MGFIRFIVFALLFYLILKVIKKFFFKDPLDKFIKDKEREYNRMRNPGKEGEIHVDDIPASQSDRPDDKKKNRKDKGGEYIDYKDLPG